MFEDHVEIIDMEAGVRMSLSSPDLALRGYGGHPHLSTRLAWRDKPEPPEA